jgi:fatty-acyl-CoA synthase
VSARKTPGKRRASAKGGTPYDVGLDRRAANYVPLTPLSFLERSAGVYPDKTAVIHGDRTFTYA